MNITKKKYSILIVDDEQDMRNLVEVMLSQSGFQSLQANPGLNVGCFITKPIEIGSLVRRIRMELEPE